MLCDTIWCLTLRDVSVYKYSWRELISLPSPNFGTGGLIWHAEVVVDGIRYLMYVRAHSKMVSWIDRVLYRFRVFRHSSGSRVDDSIRERWVAASTLIQRKQ